MIDTDKLFKIITDELKDIPLNYIVKVAITVLAHLNECIKEVN